MKIALPEGAIALLKLRESAQLVGLAELPDIFEMYGYQRDRLNPALWRMVPNQPDDGAGIEVLDECAMLIVHGRSSENVENVNHIARQAGWQTCELYALDSDAREALLAAMMNVDVVVEQLLFGEQEPKPSGAGATPPPSSVAVPSPSPSPVSSPSPQKFLSDGASDRHESSLLQDLADDHERASALLVRLAAAEEARDAAESRERDLRQTVQRLEGELNSRSNHERLESSAPLPSRLLTALEKHLVSLIDRRAIDESPLAPVLQESGYEIVLRLVPRG